MSRIRKTNIIQSNRNSDLISHKRSVLDNINDDKNVLGTFLVLKKFPLHILNNKSIQFDVFCFKNFVQIKNILDDFFIYVLEKYNKDLIVESYINPISEQECEISFKVMYTSDTILTEDIQSIKFDLEVFLLNLHSNNDRSNHYEEKANKKLIEQKDKFLKKHGGKKVTHPFKFVSNISSDEGRTDPPQDIVFLKFSDKADTKSEQRVELTIEGVVGTVSVIKSFVKINSNNKEIKLNIHPSKSKELCALMINKKLCLFVYEICQNFKGNKTINFISFSEVNTDNLVLEP